MQFRASITALFTLVSLAIGAQPVAVKNPNVLKGIVPRPAAAVAAETKLAHDALTAIDELARTEGIAKVVAEVNKGRQGAFGAWMPTHHFYLSVCEFRGPTSAVFVAHGSNPAFVGFDVPSLHLFKDGTGWYYAEALFQKADREEFEGTIEDILWFDPEWKRGQRTTMTAFNKVAVYGKHRYWLYYAIWTGQ